MDRSGTIYVAWPDCSAACERNDLVVARSTDGVRWTLRRLQLSRSGDFVIPGLGADQTAAGRIALAYYVMKPGGFLDAYVVTSRDGGRRWAAPRRLSVRTMQLRWVAQAGGAMVGDYISTSFSGGRAVSVFALAGPRGERFDQPLYASVIRP